MEVGTMEMEPKFFLFVLSIHNVLIITLLMMLWVFVLVYALKTNGSILKIVLLIALMDILAIMIQDSVLSLQTALQITMPMTKLKHVLLFVTGPLLIQTQKHACINVLVVIMPILQLVSVLCSAPTMLLFPFIKTSTIEVVFQVVLNSITSIP